MEPFAENIFLIGFMGSGKTTVSGCMSRKLGMKAVEMDEMIAEQEGMSIALLFEKKGEDYFRDIETRFLESLAGCSQLIVSCGGGVPLRQCNVEAMRRSGKVIWLTAKPSTILERVKDDTERPLLKNRKDITSIEKMIAERRPRYEKAADVIVATDGLSAEEICEEIIKKVKEMDGSLC